MRQSQKLNRKLHQEIRVQSVFHVTIYTIQNCVHSSKNVFYKNKGHTSKVCKKKPSEKWRLFLQKKSSLPIKRSSNVVSETTLVENSDDLFSIYWLLTSNIMPPITAFISTAGHTLPTDRQWSIVQFSELGKISKGKLWVKYFFIVD